LNVIGDSILDRRNFIKTGSVLGGLGALGASPAAFAKSRPLTFPKDFRWGCATAAYQIEGAVNEDGRGKSIWDVFAHTPGKVANGDTGDIACDSYHRYKEDVALLKNLGVSAYRFSIAWPRIFPDGKGKPNQKGLDYYKRLVDELLAAGIEPYATLFHWDLPAAIAGGWENRDAALQFADYAGYMAGQLSDRVNKFMTLNEMRTFIDIGYKVGIHAPGLKLPPDKLNQARHHALLAHGLGAQAIRAAARKGTQIGLAENIETYVPVIETPEHIEAAKRATRIENAMYLTAALEGKYIDEYLEIEGANAPKPAAGDMAAIGTPLDFVAINVYQPQWARADDSKYGYAKVPNNPNAPHMASPWLFVGPEVAYWAVRYTSELWKPKAIYIAENGASADDPVTNGTVYDAERVMYLRNYLSNFQRAVAEGHPLKGYFLWSLMDNFEWADGYTKRFGIHHVDFETLKRTPKLSATWYKEVIRRNRIV
jgi:beta-glucosidase